MFNINHGVIKAPQKFPEVAEVGDICYYEGDHQVYEYFDEGLGKAYGWRPVDLNKDKNKLVNLGIIEYELNKMVVSQLPPMTNDEIDKAHELIKNYTHSHNSLTGYYMLLSNELRYYTVFIVNKNYDENVEDIVFECLNDMGTIKQINEAQDGIECWIVNDDGCFMFMLFNYDWGIVTCR